MTSSGRSLIYIWESIRARMEPPETPALTGYSWEDFPFWTTQICLLLRKEEIGQIFSLKLHKT